jgi:hypothetical protein
MKRQWGILVRRLLFLSQDKASSSHNEAPWRRDEDTHLAFDLPGSVIKGVKSNA